MPLALDSKDCHLNFQEREKLLNASETFPLASTPAELEEQLSTIQEISKPDELTLKSVVGTFLLYVPALYW